MHLGSIYNELTDQLAKEAALMKEKIRQMAKSIGINAMGVAACEQDGFKSCLVFVFPYFLKSEARRGTISKYARGYDYHQVISAYLERLAQTILKEEPNFIYQINVDISPMNERSLAKSAGLGFIGKNGLLIHETYGSFVFLATMLINMKLVPDLPIANSCQNCNRCVSSCPGGALSPKGGFDLERCLSHISQKKKITQEQEALLKKGRYLWGCDVCQDVCPHNQTIPDTTICEFEENLISDFDDIEKENFRRKYADRAFSWRGYDVISRNLRIFHETLGKDNIE